MNYVIFFLFVLALFISPSCLSKTVIVSDSGNTIPLGEYTGAEKRTIKERSFDAESLKNKVEATFPLKSVLPRMKLQAYSIPTEYQSVTRWPIALVGTDKLSQKWLNKNANTLIEKGVTVIVIDADSYDAYSRFEHALKRAGIKTTWGESEAFKGIAKAYPIILEGGRAYQ